MQTASSIKMKAFVAFLSLLVISTASPIEDSTEEIDNVSQTPNDRNLLTLAHQLAYGPYASQQTLATQQMMRYQIPITSKETKIKYPLSVFFAPQLQQNLAAIVADLVAGNSKFVLYAQRTLQAERSYLA